MSHTIIIDTDRKIAALVNDDPMYALGPAIAADEAAEAQEAIEAFVDALGEPPEQMPTIQLMTEWSSFIMALAGHIAPPPAAPAEPPPAAADGAGEPPPVQDHPDAGAGGEEAAQTLAEHQAEAAAARPAGDVGGTPGPAPLPDEEPEPDEDPEAAAAISERIASAPGTPAKTGEQQCWACGGDGTMMIGSEQQDCNVCHGTGRVATPAAS